MPRRHRTFTGCWKCRERKVKCDEIKPDCLACRRLGVKCTGYSAKLVWVDSSTQDVTSQGRRVVSHEPAWAGYQLLPTDLVDILVEQCAVGCESAVSQMVYTHWVVTPEWNPFSVFATGHVSFAKSRPPESIPQPLNPSPSPTNIESFLFHHYVDHVSVLMMPYQHPRNTWKTQYPGAALESASTGRQSLYFAILAHAAFNLAHLRNSDAVMLNLGAKYYGQSMRELCSAINHQDMQFPTMISSIMTLMFAEVYDGRCRQWRRHFEGAWDLLASHYKSEPWKTTDLTCVSLQSLNVVKIIGDTSKSQGAVQHDISVRGDVTIAGPILGTSEFGFTIGASPAVLYCIRRITSFRLKRHQDAQYDCNDFVEKILAVLNPRLQQCSQAISADSSCQSHLENLNGIYGHSPEQAAAFVHATYIYLYRSVLAVPPTAVKSHVAQTFACIRAFFAARQGNFSLWPAFIAAVEAYTKEDQESAREYLGWATSVGIGSRESVNLIVEEVWRQREAISRESGLELGCISIDWRLVMRQLDCDVLLI